MAAKIQKNTKKVEFVALLKQIFNFVPRGTNVNNFFVRKIPITQTPEANRSLCCFKAKNQTYNLYKNKAAATAAFNDSTGDSIGILT